MIELTEQGKAPIKLWLGETAEDPLYYTLQPQVLQQVRHIAALPILGPHFAGMADLGWDGVGSVVATRGAVVPYLAGVDLGCGMMALSTSLPADAIKPTEMLARIENTIPIGGPGAKGSWAENSRGIPALVSVSWQKNLASRWADIIKAHPKLGKNAKGNTAPTDLQLGTLGSGNHFIELCVEQGVPNPKIWIMLHSGSRGPGNRIGQYFIRKAQDEWQQTMSEYAPEEKWFTLGDKNLAWLGEGSDSFEDYVFALRWAQDYAMCNRLLMMEAVIKILTDTGHPFNIGPVAVNCHHNYVAIEQHYGEDLFITRKGAVSARAGELGIIPGAMGIKSYIVRGKGNQESFTSCSHGAGRRLSRGAAKREISIEAHQASLEGVACRADASTLDEDRSAYKDIDAVMAAQTDLVEIVHTLTALVCVKG